MAIQNNWENVLIVEDDMVWKNFNKGYNTLQNLVNKPYDVILLGVPGSTSYILAKISVQFLTIGN